MEGLIGHHLVVGERVEPVRVGRGPLVGRDREVAHLQQCWACAQTGTLSTQGVVFRGEAGIGKSRLAAAAAELVEDSGAVVLELVGSPFHPDAGLHPVRTLIERRCGIGRLTDQPERLRLLEAEMRARGLTPGTFVPLLAPVLGIGAEAGYEPVAAEGRKLYELIAQAVQDYLYITTYLFSFYCYQLSQLFSTPLSVLVSPTEKIRGEIYSLFYFSRELSRSSSMSPSFVPC